MKWNFVTGSLDKLKTEGLALGVFEDLDFEAAADGENLSEAARRLKFKGKAGESFFAFDLYGSPRKHLLVVGLGPKDKAGPDAFRTAAATAVKKFRGRYLKTAALALPLDAAGGKNRLATAQAAVEGAILANARFQDYLTDKENLFDGIDKLQLAVAKKHADFTKGGELGEVLANATLFARNLVSHPSNVLTPKKMAEEARALAKEGGFTIKVYDARACEKMGMGAYLAVARGSRNEPQFIHLSYRPKGAKFHLGLVGKGLTFDSGGLSLKPAAGMGDMKSDMGGSAAVMGAMKALAALKPKVAVDAVMAMAENMPGGDAYRPGDILRSMSGKTIEVLNTDAEGRLTLADALWYVQGQKVDALIDLATLTGACVVALGPDFCGAMGNDQAMVDAVLAAAREAGDEMWQLPLPASYNKFLKSGCADVANISRVRWGGALTAGLFLQNFIKNGTPWVHLDIAGPALREEDGIDSHKGEGSGVGVRTLVNFILSKEK